MSDWKAREEATYWAKVPHQQAYKIYTLHSPYWKTVQDKVTFYGKGLYLHPIGCLYTKRYLWEDNYETLAICPT